MGSIMKVHHLASGLAWPSSPADTPAYENQQTTSLSLGCKPLRPVAANLSDASPSAFDAATSTSVSQPPTLDLRSFIKPECGPRRKPLPSDEDQRREPPQVESSSHPGGTRWNPTQEQIQILEMLYQGGMRTPNAHQIEQITAKLEKFGKIEGKNVFYWFQNHKARERQKLKRNSSLAPCPALTSSPAVSLDATLGVSDMEGSRESGNKRPKCLSWGFERLEIEKMMRSEEEKDNGTLELFPLRPERK